MSLKMNPFELITEINKEFKSASDRACVIVASSFLDEVLKMILISYIIEDKKSDKDIFNGYGPLSTFSSKIKISYRFGLISKEEYIQLEAIRAIRNKFAHEIKDCRLDRNDLVGLIEKLRVRRELIPPDDFELPSSSGEKIEPPIIKGMEDMSPREIFESAISVITNNLSGRVFSASMNKAESPVSFKASYEPMEIFLEGFKKQISRIEELLAEGNDLLIKKKKMESKLASPSDYEHEIKDDELFEFDRDMRDRDNVLISVTEYIIDQTKRSLGHSID
jgi:DNA-binding MltR family transcriptional regulator